MPSFFLLTLCRAASRAALGLLALAGPAGPAGPVAGPGRPGPEARPQELPLATCFALPVVGYRPNSALGYLQRNPAYANRRHVADDYLTPAGTVVTAAAAGRVMYARAYRSCPDWGYLIVIEHRLPSGERVSTIYGHTQPTVAEGTIVKKGEPIGKVASFPCWQDHVHFGVARTAYGAAVGSYASWVHGYLLDEEPEAPYTDPIAFVSAHSQCREGGR